MPNNPVQVVLNSDNFIAARETNPGGGSKDFFAERDSEFLEHKERLRKQIDAVQSTLGQSAYGGIGYAKVTLQRSALAKSHRPTQALFTPARTRIVGSEGIGQLLIEVTPEGLQAVGATVQDAEERTRKVFNEKLGREVYRPSRRRSEVGAIEQVELWGPADKRRFSAEVAVQWLSDLRTGSAYRVYLFDFPPPRSDWDALDSRKRALFQSFINGLEAFGEGLGVELLEALGNSHIVVNVRLARSAEPAFVQLWEPPHRKIRRRFVPVDPSVTRHERLLQFLDHHPLVRAIELPPRLHRSRRTDRNASPEVLQLPVPGQGNYPVVGVIDGGISEHLNEWVISRWGLLADEDRDENHGTLIGGILVAGKSMNPSGAVMEPDGCKLIDIDIFPRDDRGFSQYYPNGVADFFDEVEQAIADCRGRFGVRVFNLSLNTNLLADIAKYSVEAGRLDHIAETYDALLVISAGNLNGDARPEWRTDNDQVLADLAASRNDGILVPAESIRNVSVGALNPPGHPTCIAHAPTGYTRRGPGLRTGVKPDLAHVGGAGQEDPAVGSGLSTCAPDGSTCTVRGTSFAAPQVAKTIATLDSKIEGNASRETLTALMVHNSTLPEPLRPDVLRRIARDMVGFGLPSTAEDILLGDDHQITLVFANRLMPGKELSFEFSWPASLVTEAGKCSGDVRVSLVATPPLDYNFGAEFVRVNIEAALQQEDGDSFKGRLGAAYLPEAAEKHSYEADLIEHALKWSPTKIYARRMSKGVGKSSRWRLNVGYLTRADEPMPEKGVPFTAILTIADIDGERPVFNEVRQSLVTQGVQTADIQIAARVTIRV
jgi:hypothetical protein